MVSPGTAATLAKQIAALPQRQIEFVRRIVLALTQPLICYRDLMSDIVFDPVLLQFGIELQAHHANVAGAMTKKHFERAFQRSLELCGRNAQLAVENNPGRDITIDDVGFSLKTQADAGIRVNTIHISKYMELGEGDWGDDLAHLPGLRQQFLDHLTGYDRILSLRAFRMSPTKWRYELVEIPKMLMLEARNGVFRWGELREPLQPGEARPAYCDVRDDAGSLKYSLYFDGRGERKLQVKYISTQLCVIHAVWFISIIAT